MRTSIEQLHRDTSVDSNGGRVGYKRAFQTWKDLPRDPRPCDAASGFNPCGLAGKSPARARARRHARVPLPSKMSAQTREPADHHHQELVPPIPSPLFSVAPMMDVTDRHFRFLFRQLSRRAVLWTEMVGSSALAHRPELAERFLKFHPCEHPLVLQLGGNKPDEIRGAAELARAYGYDEVNLNCGCPSQTVAGKGCFGAALMREPELVAEVMSAFREGAGGLDASVKCRIGVDDLDSYEYLHKFVSTVAEQGNVKHFIVHARKALLGAKFSPEDNRRVPPLRHDRVLRLVEDFPDLRFTLNGGITTYEEVNAALEAGVAGVMIGRAAMNRPWYWSRVDELIYGEPPSTEDRSREAVLAAYCEYGEERLAEFAGQPVERKIRRFLVRALENLFSGEIGGKQFRATLNNELRNTDLSFTAMVERAMARVPPKILRMQPEDMDLSKIESKFEGSRKKVIEKQTLLHAPAPSRTGDDVRHMHAIGKSAAESRVIMPLKTASSDTGRPKLVEADIQVRVLSVKGLLKRLQALGSNISRKRAQLVERLKSRKAVKGAEMKSQKAQKVRFRSRLANDIKKQLNAFGQKISRKKAEQIERLKQHEGKQKSREDQHKLSGAESATPADVSDSESLKTAESAAV